MSTHQPGRDTISTQEIAFPNGNRAHAVFLPSDTDVQQVPFLLTIPSFRGLIMLAGGAGFMEDNLYPNLAQLFSEGIARFAADHDMLVVDGGTQAGVMELMGTAIAEQGHRSPLLGVSPAGLVSYPGQPDTPEQEEHIALDPNHSHFVLVETEEWGGETATMYQLASIFSRECPSVAVIVNGGAIIINEALYNVRQHRPMIVFEGSGRAADEIARLWREKPATIEKPELAEIVTDGDIHLFPIHGSPVALRELIAQLL